MDRQTNQTCRRAAVKITRPLLRYHGGKWKLAPWVISQFPPHSIYVEAFGGAASVLLRKPRVAAEIYNDLDSEVVKIFRVLQDPAKSERLFRRIYLTPFARDELKSAYSKPKDDVDAAVKMLTRSFMGFGSAAMTRSHITGFRSSTKRDRYNSPPAAVEWQTWPLQIQLFVERLRGVVIENRDALTVMQQHDSRSTLHYVDPPYVLATRSSTKNRGRSNGHFYRHDMTDADHVRLAEFLHSVEGMVVLSGYKSDLYQQLYGRWDSASRNHMADGGRARVETLWFNPAAQSLRKQTELF